jgi:hypothetical protein
MNSGHLDLFFSSLVYISSISLMVYFFTLRNVIGPLIFFCLVDFHGQFDVWAAYGVAVWCTVVLQSFSSWEICWNGAYPDLQFNIIHECVIFLCWCSYSICSVQQLGKIVNVDWWLSVLFYRLHFVDVSSLATCIAVEVMLDVQSHLIID